MNNLSSFLCRLSTVNFIHHGSKLTSNLGAESPWTAVPVINQLQLLTNQSASQLIKTDDHSINNQSVNLWSIKERLERHLSRRTSGADGPTKFVSRQDTLAISPVCMNQTMILMNLTVSCQSGRNALTATHCESIHNIPSLQLQSNYLLTESIMKFKTCTKKNKLATTSNKDGVSHTRRQKYYVKIKIIKINLKNQQHRNMHQNQNINFNQDKRVWIWTDLLNSILENNSNKGVCSCMTQ